MEERVERVGDFHCSNVVARHVVLYAGETEKVARKRSSGERNSRQRKTGRKKERKREGRVSRVFRPASAAGRAAIGRARYRTAYGTARGGSERYALTSVRYGASRGVYGGTRVFLTSRGEARTRTTGRDGVLLDRVASGVGRRCGGAETPLCRARLPAPSFPRRVSSTPGARVHDMRPVSVRTSHCPCRLTLGATASRAGYSPRQPRRASTAA